VNSKPDVILVNSGSLLRPLQQETHTIPIVFVQINDPVAFGFVANLAHPGGNVTGFTPVESSLGGKWLELIMKIAPSITRVAVVLNPESPGNIGMWHAIESVVKDRYGRDSFETPRLGACTCGVVVTK
jgi:putative tryptophan/tyrosine transport system substrate-binding protein